MRKDLGKQLQRLIRRQQMCIWRKRISSRMSPLIWWSAAALFLGGCVHQLWLPLDTLAVACVAILPSLLALAWLSASARPSADIGAAAADRLVGANALLVSAWELSRSTAAAQGVGPLLLARTEIALPGWRQRLKLQPRRTLHPARLSAVTLGLIGLFFLLLPPHSQTRETPSTAALTQPQPLIRADDPARALGELFEQRHKPSTEGAKQRPDLGRPHAALQTLPPQLQPESARTASAKVAEDLARPAATGEASPLRAISPVAPAALSPGASRTAGDKVPARTPGEDSAKGTAMALSRAGDFARIRLIDIETGGDTRASAFDTSRKADVLMPAKPKQPVPLQSTSHDSRQVAQADSASRLTAQQRTWVRRYFKQLEQIDESAQ